MSNTSLGFIGLGSLGLPIAVNLLSAGFALDVHTRSRKAERNKGLEKARSFSNPKDLARGCDVLFVCVSDDDAIEDVLFSSKGASKSLKHKSIVIDLSTINPSKSRNIAARLAQKNILYIDAPVTGGTEGAKAGTLTMFLGCNKKNYDQISNFLKPITRHAYCFGDVGKGQEVKAINQILVAGSYAALAEAIAVGQNLDLPMDIVVEALQSGAGGSWALENRSRLMIDDEYPLGFKLSLHHKDLSIALQTASELGLELPITKKVREIEKRLIENGFGNQDVSALRKSI